MKAADFRIAVVSGFSRTVVQIPGWRLPIDRSAAWVARPAGIGADPGLHVSQVMVPVSRRRAARDRHRRACERLRPAPDSRPPNAVRRARERGVCERPALKELARDGYIFVVQNLRGRFGSEGTFELTSKAISKTRNDERDERTRTTRSTG